MLRVIITLLISINLYATTRYVATTGTDTTGNACTVSTSPCKTIQRAVSASSAGDVITVANGTYGPVTWNGSTDVNAYSMGSNNAYNNGYVAVVNLTTSGTSASPITIQATNPCFTNGTSGTTTCNVFLNGGLVTCTYTAGIVSGSTPCFTGAGDGTSGNPACNCADTYFQETGTASYWTIKGFDISNTWFTGSFTNSGSPNHISFIGNNFHNIGNRVWDFTAPGQTDNAGIVGIFTGGGQGQFTADGNIFQSIGRVPITYVIGGGTICSGNYNSGFGNTGIYNDDYVHDHGLYLFGGPWTVINNIFWGNSAGWGFQTAGGNVATVYGNTFVGGSNPCKDGVIVLYLSNTVTISNNIFANAVGYDMDNYDTTQSGSTFSFNFSCPTNSGPVTPASGGGSVTTGITYSNNTSGSSCNFSNLSNHGYSPLTGSPVIGIGTNIASSNNHDFANNPRPTSGGAGTGFDDGAYQYQSGSIPPAILVKHKATTN